MRVAGSALLVALVGLLIADAQAGSLLMRPYEHLLGIAAYQPAGSSLILQGSAGFHLVYWVW
ncbi:MAG: hypothetical protein KAY32_13015 [Candidatus Eisenbacteria sp.]|nr:hypothetical protein [Candidatus Eisenbacteria bacterium]